MGILIGQISSNLIESTTKIDELTSLYYKKLWEKRNAYGFFKPSDFWEIPLWASLLKGNVPDSDFSIVHNINDFLYELNTGCYSYCCFSALDANKYIIKDIVKKYQGNTTFAIGGYINLHDFFGAYDNVAIFPSMENFSHHLTGQYEEKYDYSFFKKWKCIPRLILSDGCLNQCDFCTVNKKITEKDEHTILKQINAFSDLDYELVYIGDKTFGQSSNYNLLSKINKRLHEENPKFKGFIIQTTAKQLLKIPDKFLINAGVKYVEIGIESFNDKILKSHNKPSSEKSILKATEKIKSLPIKAIPNIIIGLNGENHTTYGHTIKYIQDNVDIFSHLNIYHLAIYDNTPLSKKNNGLQLNKSFIQNLEPHQWFHDELFNLGLHILDSF